MAGNPNSHNCVSVEGTKLKWNCGLSELERFLKSRFSRGNNTMKEQVKDGVKFTLDSPPGHVTFFPTKKTLLCQRKRKGIEAEEIKSRISNQARSW
jgi:hypothetical protein